MKAPRSLAPVLLLAACASPQPAVQTVYQTKLITPAIAPELLTCGDAPRVPSNAEMQSEIARYVVALWEWGSDCQSRLAAVKQSLDISTTN